MEDVNYFKGDLFGFCFVSLALSVSFRFLCMSKISKDKKVKVCTNRSSTLPQKTLLLKRLVSSSPVTSCYVTETNIWHIKMDLAQLG